MKELRELSEPPADYRVYFVTKDGETGHCPVDASSLEEAMTKLNEQTQHRATSAEEFTRGSIDETQI